MSAAARFTLGIVALAGAVAFVLVGRTLGPNLPAGEFPFLCLAAFCVVIACACMVPAGRTISLRIIGVVVFGTYVWYVIDTIGNQQFWLALSGLFYWGLPAGYVAIWARYPSWGKGAEAFGSEPPAAESAEEFPPYDEFDDYDSEHSPDAADDRDERGR